MKRTITNNIFKDSVTFLMTSTESDGKISKLEVTLKPKGRNPLHYHKYYSEKFVPIEGYLGLGIGYLGKKILKPGETYTVKPSELHYFYNPEDTEIKFISEIRPGHSGFENSLRILYGLANDGLTNNKGVPKKIKDIAVIATMSDMNLPGLFTLFFPILKRIANKAMTSGYEKQLLDRYCN